MTALNGHGSRYELPHHTELEASILGGVILRNDALDLLDDLGVDDFYDLRHKVVFQAIRNLQARGRPIDIALLEAEIEKAGKLEAIGGVGYLGELALSVPTVGNVEHYRDEVRRASRNRTAIIELSSALERAKRGVYDPSELIIETVGELQRLVPAGEPGAASLKQRWCVPLADFLGDEEPSDDDSEDWIIRDVVPRGEAGLIAGPPKCGKTWAMLDVGLHVALGRPWLGGMQNTLGRPGRVLALAFEDGQRRLRKRTWELARAMGVSPNHPDLRAHLSISREPLSLPGDERALAAELKAWKPDLVLIDNLTRVMAGDQNAIKDAKRFSDVWCKLCSDVGAAVVFLHHTSKVGPIRQDQRNTGDPFELIRGSGDLVASARHLVLMRPLESPDDSKLADVRMRGNLDLRREDFVLSFARVHRQERWVALITDRGDGDTVRDELADKRREKQEERKAQRSGRSRGDGANSVDERVYAKLIELHHGGARDLCTLEQLKESSGVQRAAVRPSLDRLIHAGKVRAETVKRFEGSGMRSRAIFVPIKEVPA